MSVLYLSRQRQAAAARVHRRPAVSATCRGALVFIEIVGRRVAGFGVPAAFQPAVAIEPMTGERRGWRPAPAHCRRATKTRQIVIGMYDVAELRHEMPQPHTSEFSWEFCEFCEHCSPPHPLCAAGRRAKGDRLSPITNPHAAKASATNLDVLRHREPDSCHRIGVAKGGTAHVLFIRVERLVSNEAFSTIIGKYA